MMIRSYDDVFKETRLILLGRTSMRPEFKKLADWIDDTFQVRTLNIFYELNKEGQPVLEICFEYEYEWLKFIGGELLYETEKQRAIAGEFGKNLVEDIENGNAPEWCQNVLDARALTENVLVIFAAFEPIARMDIFERVRQEEVEELKHELKIEGLWGIHFGYGRVVFFMFTEEQVQKYKDDSVVSEWKMRCFDLLDRYNEFGYLARGNFSIVLDSKENFERGHGGSWYDYNR